MKNKHLYILLNESYRSLFPLSICNSLTFYVNIMMQILKCILASQFLVAFKSHQLTNNRTPHLQSIWAPTGWHFGLLSVASILRTPLLPLASTTSSLSLICSNATSVLNSSLYSKFWLLKLLVCSSTKKLNKTRFAVEMDNNKLHKYLIEYLCFSLGLGLDNGRNKEK